LHGGVVVHDQDLCQAHLSAANPKPNRPPAAKGLPNCHPRASCPNGGRRAGSAKTMF
jgi:hypothetical protein